MSREVAAHYPLQAIARLLAATAVAIGLGAILGWLTGLRALVTFGHGLPPIAMTTAVALVAAGLALIVLMREPVSAWRRLLANGLIALTALIGAASVVAHTAGGWVRSYGRSWQMEEGAVLLLPLPAASVLILVLALALALFERGRGPRPRVAEYAALVAAALASLPLIAYFLHASFLYTLTTQLGMALPSALGGFALAIGLLLARPGHGFALILDDPGPAGSVARRFLPAVLTFPVVLWLVDGGLRQLGLADTVVGASLAVLLLMGLAATLTFTNAFAIARVEADLHKVRAEQAFLATLVEATDEAVVATTPAGTVLSWNPAAERLFGYTAAEMVGEPLSLLAPPDRLTEHARLSARVADGHRIEDHETTRIHKDGSVLRISATYSPVRSPDGSPVGMVAVAREITEQARLADALREREAQLSGVIDNAHDAILFLDAEGRVTNANPSAEALLGQGRAKLMGRPLGELVSGPGGGGGGAAPLETAASDEPVLAEGHRLDGERFPAEVSVSRVETTEQAFSVAFIRDLTERTRAAEQLARAAIELEQAHELERIKDHIFSTISHETRTPLSLIQGYAELLEDRYPGDDLVPGLVDGVERLTAQIGAIVDYAALLGGHMPLFRTLVSPAELVKALVERERARVAQAHLQLEVELEPDLPGVYVDPRRIDQVLAALLDNAIKFTPAGRRVGISARRSGACVGIAVWDTGPGLDPAILAGIGEPFRQADMGDAGRRGGMGLGLAIATQIVDLHGANLDIATGHGAGTRFEVMLPIAEEPGEGP